MQVEPIGSATDSVGRAHDVALEALRRDLHRRIAEQREQASPAISPSVALSPIFSPVIYAQAAQLHLYTQLGTLAALGLHGSVQSTPSTNHADSIAAVEGTEGSRVDTSA